MFNKTFLYLKFFVFISILLQSNLLLANDFLKDIAAAELKEIALETCYDFTEINLENIFVNEKKELQLDYPYKLIQTLLLISESAGEKGLFEKTIKREEIQIITFVMKIEAELDPEAAAQKRLLENTHRFIRVRSPFQCKNQ